jgi:hypothetical protein
VEVGASQPFEAVYGPEADAVVGTIAVVVIDNQGNAVIGPTTADIVQNEVAGIPTGIFTWSVAAAPADLGQYSIVWSPDGTWDPDTNSVPEELLVVGAGTSPSPIPSPAEGGAPFGPATSWVTADEIAECCELVGTTDPDVLQPYGDTASQLLFLNSGRLFYGLSSKTVRPLCRPNCPCGQVLSRGHIVPSPRWDWWGLCEGPCDPSRVLLSGYPVREITQVKIDGTVIDEDGYRLERMRWLVRKGGDRWPACQNMGLDDTEEGTWSVTYTFGQAPPLAGVEAAKELACELYRSCNAADDCAIPQGAVRVTRAGITIERGVLRRDPVTKAWKTGMLKVDLFLNAVNPNGLLRRPMVWSNASKMRMARKVA